MHVCFKFFICYICLFQDTPVMRPFRGQKKKHGQSNPTRFLTDHSYIPPLRFLLAPPDLPVLKSNGDPDCVGKMGRSRPPPSHTWQHTWENTLGRCFQNVWLYHNYTCKGNSSNLIVRDQLNYNHVYLNLFWANKIHNVNYFFERQNACETSLERRMEPSYRFPGRLTTFKSQAWSTNAWNKTTVMFTKIFGNMQHQE